MSIGVLILRLLLALILIAHSGQKTFGWFQGRGLDSMAIWFAALGLKPGRGMVILASVTEVAAAISLVAGFLTPLGALAACAAMLVAGMTMHIDAGRLWNAGGGGEYPYFISAVALSLAFIGPGAFSIDALLAARLPWFAAVDHGAVVGVIVAVVAAVGALPFAFLIRRNRSALQSESA